MEQHSFKLRHSIQPYSLILIVLFLVIILSVYIGIAKNDWGGLITMLVVLGFYLMKVYFYDFRYGISYDDNLITMQYAGFIPDSKNQVSIKIADISEVKRETSNIQDLTAQRRVTQRIAIYGNSHNKFIDVSLKHFVPDDVRKLMDLIKEKRPELNMPQVK